MHTVPDNSPPSFILREVFCTLNYKKEQRIKSLNLDGFPKNLRMLSI